jgi:hypothetical protein
MVRGKAYTVRHVVKCAPATSSYFLFSDTRPGSATAHIQLPGGYTPEDMIMARAMNILRIRSQLCTTGTTGT